MHKHHSHMRGISQKVLLFGIGIIISAVALYAFSGFVGSNSENSLSFLSAIAPEDILAAVSTPKIKDYLIQDVCLNFLGFVIPVDPASSQCVFSRDLRFNEGLPYHKHDQKGNDTNPAAAQGYQRSDSFPIVNDVSKSIPAIVSTLDFGVGGATFGAVDANIDGYNLYEMKGLYASIYGTKDPTGVSYFISPLCKVGKGNEDSWGLFPTGASTTGTKIFSLMIASSPTACPKTFDTSYTAWEFPGILTYTNGVKLDSAISYHYSHATGETSDHLEKFFFTRKYGLTRWERWERPNTPYHTNEAARSAAKEATGVCNGPWTSTDSVGTWYRVDCREWTMIIPETTSTTWKVPAY